jgi:hypothetical protein
LVAQIDQLILGSQSIVIAGNVLLDCKFKKGGFMVDESLVRGSILRTHTHPDSYMHNVLIECKCTRKYKVLHVW